MSSESRPSGSERSLCCKAILNGKQERSQGLGLLIDSDSGVRREPNLCSNPAPQKDSLTRCSPSYSIKDHPRTSDVSVLKCLMFRKSARRFSEARRKENRRVVQNWLSYDRVGLKMALWNFNLAQLTKQQPRTNLLKSAFRRQYVQSVFKFYQNDARDIDLLVTRKEERETKSCIVSKDSRMFDVASDEGSTSWFATWLRKEADLKAVLFDGEAIPKWVGRLSILVAETKVCQDYTVVLKE